MSRFISICFLFPLDDIDLLVECSDDLSVEVSPGAGLLARLHLGHHRPLQSNLREINLGNQVKSS